MKNKPASQPMQAALTLADMSFCCTGPDRTQLPYHYHATLEVLYCQHGHGTVIVGNHVGSYSAGELFVVGKNVPHAFIPSGEETAGVHGIEFYDSFLGEGFFANRDFKDIENLFGRAARGVKITEPSDELTALFMGVSNGTSPHALLSLIQLLHRLSKEPKATCLNAGDCVYYNDAATPVADTKRMAGKLEKVIDHTRRHYAEPISLSQMANLINFTETSFCRFFKERMGKSYFQFLNEVRVDNACRLLIEWPNKSIEEISFECGFNNSSTFYKQFKRIVKRTPKEYQLRGKTVIAVGTMVA